MNPLVPVMHPKTIAYPEGSKGPPEEIPYLFLDQILTEPADFDAHFCAYSKPELPYRLKLEALPLPMVLAVFDVDPPNHEVTPEWRRKANQNIRDFRADHPKTFVYETRGGYRIIAGTIDYTLETPEDLQAWHAIYVTWCNYLYRRFRIQADKACKDATRLYRAPHATRDGEVQNFPTYGDHNIIGAWDPDCSEEDIEQPKEAKLPESNHQTAPGWQQRIPFARTHLKNCEPCVQGAGDTRLYAVCQETYVGFDLPIEEAANLIREDFLPRCDPNSGTVQAFEERLAHKLPDAGAKADRLDWGATLRRATIDAAIRKAAAPPPPETYRIHWVSANEMSKPLPPVNWVVESLQIGPGRPVLWTGYGASAKTISAQSLLLAYAAGKPAWGHFMTGRKGKVRHFDHEQGTYATIRRYQRLARGMGIDLNDIGDQLAMVSFPDLRLTDQDAVDAYARECEGVDLVLIDALKGAVRGEDENDSRFRDYVDVLGMVSEKVGTAFIAIQHGNKPNGQTDNRTKVRGSSAIFDAAGCVFYIQGEVDQPRLVEQIKTPAEAEGKGVAPFQIMVEDVVANNLPGGVRVVYSPTSKDTKAEDLDQQVYLFLMGHPHVSANRIASQLKKSKGNILASLEELLRTNKIINEGTKSNAEYVVQPTAPRGIK